MGREFELKYQADAETICRIRDRFGDFHPIAMETTYFDTPDASLRSRKWMLRQRRENGKIVCTLKIPLPDGSRGEWEVNSPDLSRAVALLLEKGCPRELEAIAAGGLVPRCGARFTRLAKTLALDGGSAELALDQGEFLAGDKAIPFTEVEVELKDGPEEICTAFAQALAADYCLKPQHLSKAQRAFAAARD